MKINGQTYLNNYFMIVFVVLFWSQAQTRNQRCLKVPVFGKNLTVNCSNQQIVLFPAKQLRRIANQADIIDFRKNEIDYLPANAIANQMQLSTLILAGNFIEGMDDAFFNLSGSGHPHNVSPLKIIDLSDNHLHSIPRCFGEQTLNIPSLSNLHTLSFAGNLFGDHLRKNSFRNAKNIVNLDMSGCRISVVPDTLFKDLTKLVEINLSNNDLHELPLSLFSRKASLKVLKLENNFLETVPYNLPNSVRELYLSANTISSDRSNFTSSDHKDYTYLKNLKILDLSRNKLMYLSEGFSKMFSQLLYLDLSFNSIYNIEKNALNGAKNLKVLFLENNTLSVVHKNELSELPNLLYLFAFNCQLHTLNFVNDTNIQKTVSLKNIWLFDNPMTCNCRMLPLVQFLKKNSIMVDQTFNVFVPMSGEKRVDYLTQQKVQRISYKATPTLCKNPKNRHNVVVGKPIINVTESHLTCPDQLYYIIMSSSLGLIAFVGVIPVVIGLIQTYLFFSKYAKKHILKKEAEKED